MFLQRKNIDLRRGKSRTCLRIFLLLDPINADFTHLRDLPISLLYVAINCFAPKQPEGLTG